MTILIHKNKHYDVMIDDLGRRGEGVGRIGIMVIYIPGALPGDRVESRVIKVKKRYAIGKLIRIISPSPDRVSPPCPVAERCGGCQIQHLRYEAQLILKERRINDAFERIGGITDLPLKPIIGMSHPFNYRNKAQFAIGRNGSSIESGFYAIHSHRIIDTDRCEIQHPLVHRALMITKDFLHTYSVSLYDESSHTGVVRHFVTRVSFSNKQLVVGLVINGNTLPNAQQWIAMMMQCPGVIGIFLNHNTSKGDTVLSDRCTYLLGDCLLEEQIGHRRFLISPLSFFQVNPVQTKKLYDAVVQAAELTGSERVWDLYCGTGSIAIFIASAASSVIGVDDCLPAIEDAHRNTLLNNDHHVDFICAKAEDIVFKDPRFTKKPDCVILDPPRKGCDVSLLTCIGQKLRVPRIVYVSCDPATLARDAAHLVSFGYKIDSVQPVDMFPHTTHIESVTALKLVDF